MIRPTNDEARGGTATVTDVPTLLRIGPVAEALAAITAAECQIHQSKAAFASSRDALPQVLRTAVARVGEQVADGDGIGDQLRAVVASLYWDHPVVRVADIAAGTGIDSAHVHVVAGPRRVTTACRRCGSPTAVLQTRRRDVPSALCDDCRGVLDAFEAHDVWAGPSRVPLVSTDWDDG